MTDALKGAVIALVNATLGAFQAFGVPLSNDQQAAVMGVVNAALIAWMLYQHRQGSVAPGTGS